MVAKNDITGDSIQSKETTDKYRNNYDLIFGKKKKTEAEKQSEAFLKNEYYDLDDKIERYNEETQEVKRNEIHGN